MALCMWPAQSHCDPKAADSFYFQRQADHMRDRKEEGVTEQVLEKLDKERGF